MSAPSGQSQFVTAPTLARNISLALEEHDYSDEHAVQTLEESDDRLVQVLASQSRSKEGRSLVSDDEAIVSDEKLSEIEKRKTLQGILTMAASNGETRRVQQLLSGAANPYLDINAPDVEGTPPLIYASCFGHASMVSALLQAGADVDATDRYRGWTPLMWSINNHHKEIARTLVDHGASLDLKSSSGRTALDFLPPDSDMSDYLGQSGYAIGNAGVTDDFYNSGFSQDRFEEEMAENEFKRRMIMESAMNLEVDLGNLDLDEQPEDHEFEEPFMWDQCLPDQMFVFQENELGRILDIIITNMTPQRTPSVKPIPANILFLGARYAHYHANPELLEALLVTAMDKINYVVERHQSDMTLLAFWLSNLTLLLYYLKKDSGLVGATTEFQLQMAELINEIFILVIRDAERRMERFLDGAMLDHETIPGFEDVHFQNEWKLFRTKPKVKAPEPIEKLFRPPRAQVSPRNVTSLLSSTLFVLDIYDIHSIITCQILSQLLYWLGAELFNRVMSNRKYLSRTKAMQIRMNVSSLEDWARMNNRQPEHYENGSMTSTGESTVDAARRHLAPVIQLLQWLQCFSSLGDDIESLVGTLQQLPRLTPQQLLHVVKYYRAEVGEGGLPKSAKDYLVYLHDEAAERSYRLKKGAEPVVNTMGTPISSPTKNSQTRQMAQTPSARRPSEAGCENEDAPESLLLDSALMLPFSLPTSTDMLISYGAGFGGMNRERESKYIPTVPPEFLAKLDDSGNKNGSQL